MRHHHEPVVRNSLDRVVHLLRIDNAVFATANHQRGPIELIRARMEDRSHRYMPASLLESQFATLEPPVGAIEVDIAQAPERCVEAIAAALAR